MTSACHAVAGRWGGPVTGSAVRYACPDKALNSSDLHLIHHRPRPLILSQPSSHSLLHTRQDASQGRSAKGICPSRGFACSESVGLNESIRGLGGLSGCAGADSCSRKPSLFAVEPIHAFYMFLAANLVSALFNPIQDCDETFNFLEPTHYLSHGYGLQTWEWSPAYGIRDWLYVLPHAVIAGVRHLLPQATKVRLFVCNTRYASSADPSE